MQRIYSIIGILLWTGIAREAFAQTNVMVLDTFIESHRIEDVSANWETITLANDYSDPVVVCTYVLPSDASNEAHTRVRNVTASTSTTPAKFDVRVQRFETLSDVTISDVHCLVVDAGAHTLEDGRKIDAGTVISEGTNGSVVGWSNAETENVTTSLSSGFSSLVVLGQVMSFNDAKASVFWTHNCSNRGVPPTPTNFCVSKHIGKVNGTRQDETLGYIVVEPGSGSTNGVTYAFAKGSDTVRGVGDSPPYSYSVSGDFETAILTQAAEDGGDGGWAVLYGADPLPANSIRLAVEEETFANTSSRRHTTEEVYYSAFRSTQTALFSADKTVTVASDSPTDYAIPGSDIIYKIAIENTGTGAADLNSIFLVDSLPSDMEFFNGDMDGAGPASGPVLFEPGDSGLTMSSGDIGYSFDSARPTSMAECDDTPASGYVKTVRHICFSPKGYARPGSLYPANLSNISFRMKIP